MGLWAPGMRLTAARLNRDWQPYPVQWTAATTNPSIGDGTLRGAYRYLDAETIQLRIRLAPGSSTAFGTGQYRFSLPVPVPMGGINPWLDAHVLISGALYPLVGWSNTLAVPATLISMYRMNPTSTENVSTWTSTAPAAFGSGHVFSLFGTYSIAAGA